MDTCRVMQNGFQFATGKDRCIVFLFHGWNVNNHVKYAVMIVGIFCMGLLNGALAYIRHRLNENTRENSSLLLNQIYLALVYGIQIVLAYWIMLLVMTYESGSFISLIFGLVIGYFIFGYIQAKNRLSKNKVSLANETYENQFNSTPCCQTTA
ncbi:unnamed protein product [Rotaria sp. Silwood2]|nr:unnamed protein product [Rotaria sp. Silwood2]CAF2911092.1 unnamed protein product [Rotaria sp. Silwood2]CAF3039118.1 unnamed protein product [Rotaria sp. Silwood2]CAF3388602.1 unnamed protein product [Rotaria sp. Silwood2]CAF3894833.1 unnamed protein product [Rotaria sp. Silwood2]